MKVQVQKHAIQVINTIRTPFDNFLRLETASGILLMVTTMLALALSNSPFAESYEHFIHFPFSIGAGKFILNKSLHWWVNDALMAIFFFVVGLEIKRELVCGELSTVKKAALPMLAALGGMIVPALIYVVFNIGEPTIDGWGIPMATDIAFAVGILILMNRKVPFALKVFLLALAIVDDLGAVLVIAFFYTEEITRSALGFAALFSGLIFIFNLAGVKSKTLYLILAVLVWSFILKSGVHATIAGVILGFLTPSEPLVNKNEIAKNIDALSAELSKDLKDNIDVNVQPLSALTESKLDNLNQLITDSKSPLERLIHLLHPWVSYIIMPLFAFVNAGIPIGGIGFGELFTNHISLGIIFGLFVGKPLGVLLASFLAVKLNIARLPRGVTWTQMTAVGFLAGIGFTMALFVSNLALKFPELETFSKLGILAGSALSAVAGVLLLYFHKDVCDIKTDAPKAK